MPKIFNHAHLVFGSISFIQMVQPVAGEGFTRKTKPGFTLLEGRTVFDSALRSGFRLIRIFHPTSGAFIFCPQIGHANTTIHPTGRNQGKSI